MPEQEKNLEKEMKNNAEDFAEKLKSAENAESKTGESKDELEKLIKRNQEMVHEREVTIEQAQEQKIEISSPVKNTQKDDEKGEKKEQKQKEHVKFHANDITSLQNPDDQITKIVDLASKKDPYFAIKVAKHIDNNYILDRVHDQLTEPQVRAALIKKGLLEEIK